MSYPNTILYDSLFNACTNDDFDSVKQFLDESGDTKLSHIQSLEVLFMAAENYEKDDRGLKLFEYLLNHEKVNQTHYIQNTCFMYASRRGMSKVVELFINDIEFPGENFRWKTFFDFDNFGSFRMACMYGRGIILEMFFERISGFDPTVSDHIGLRLAAEHGWNDIIDKLTHYSKVGQGVVSMQMCF